MGFAADIMDLLSTGGIAASTMFGGDLPERPVTALCITPTPGLGSQHSMGSTVGAPLLESLRFQVRVRAADYASADALMVSAHGKLDGLRRKSVNGKTYQWITGESSPFYLGLDEEERPLFACNYSASRTLSTQ